ncbi:MAG TPA: hypothetical protein K8U70_05710, partial [Facklamia tabacinasalis]|nr:hypothetical protein [Ruoffia tabacinasalis]
MNSELAKASNFEKDIYYFNQGTHRQAYKFLGSQRVEDGSKIGYRFNVWAPNAKQVFIQGDFT